MYRTPAALKRRLEQFRLVGRRVVAAAIEDDCGACAYAGPFREDAFPRPSEAEDVFFETDGCLQLFFEDGSVLSVDAHDSRAWEVEFSGSGDVPATAVSGADAAFSEILGVRVACVEMATVKSDKDAYGNWIDGKRHRQFAVVEWVVLAFDNGCAVGIGTWIDYAVLKLTGPDGKPVRKTPLDGLRMVKRFRAGGNATQNGRDVIPPPGY
jgi:hypothetical protein